MTTILEERPTSRHMTSPRTSPDESGTAPLDTKGRTPTEGMSPVTGRERARQFLAGVVIAAFLSVTVAGLIPTSAARTATDRIFGPAINLTGINQNWAVFSPDPLQLETHTYALVYFADGTASEWRPPAGNPVDSSRMERWRKWETRIRLDSNEAQWPTTARYIAGIHANEANPVASVRLVRTWAEVPPPSEPVGPREIREFDFYEWDHLSETGYVLADIYITGGEQR